MVIDVALEGPLVLTGNDRVLTELARRLLLLRSLRREEKASSGQDLAGSSGVRPEPFDSWANFGWRYVPHPIPCLNRRIESLLDGRWILRGAPRK